MRVGANDFRTKLIGGLGEGMLEASPHVGRGVILINTKAAWGASSTRASRPGPVDAKPMQTNRRPHALVSIE
jgi:hypothetical protein